MFEQIKRVQLHDNDNRIKMLISKHKLTFKPATIFIFFIIQVTISLQTAKLIEAKASLSGNLATPIKWNNDAEHQNKGLHGQQTIPAATMLTGSTNSIERRADRDPEEEFDEDDRDEDKSGSNNHGSYENPSFGESRRAALDGEEIETFFDKHLGPPTDGTGAVNSDPDTDMSKPVVSERVDPDDGYETAASSPLSDIFHTLIKAHRRPFVITTTTGQQVDESPSSSTENQNSAPATSSSANNQQVSASNLMGSSSQAGPPFLKGTPYMDPSPFPTIAQAAAVPPMAYYAPIASSSTLNPYEPSSAAAASPDGQDDYANNNGREIYIVRRPSVLQHIRAVAPPIQRLVQQSSNAHWRGIPFGAPGPYLAPRPYPSEESSAASSDYHNYPIGAHSYSYPREHPQQAQREAASSEPDEPTNVSYSLSFGGQPSSADSASDEQDNGPDEQSSVDEAPGQAPAPYQSGYSAASRQPGGRGFTSSSSRAYNNYNYPPMVPTSSSHYQPQGHYHGARYHKDPSESNVQPINYAQYSPMQSGSNQGDYASWLTRQQLLANLDRQIKNNQYYKQNMAQQSQRAPIMVHRRFKTPLSKDNNDVDSYSSFHSEIDPYKSFIASSKLVNEPQPDSQKSVGQRNEDDGNSDAASSKNTRHEPVDHNESENSSSNEKTNRHLLTGPVSNLQQHEAPKANHRVRREDADDRENDEVDDDGVWVDDDEDEDNRQTASDLNETTQDPEEDENQQEVTRVAPVPGVIGNPHGYELSR